MKQLLFIPLVIAAFAASNASALTIKHGKVIKQKEWASEGATAQFLPSAKISPPKEMQTKRGNNRYYVFTEMHPLKATVGEMSSINSFNYISASNDSEEMKQYRLYMNTCTLFSEKLWRCAHYYKHIELEPHGYFSEELEPIVKLRYTQPGTYRSYSYASLDEIPSYTHLGHATTESVVVVS